MTRIRLIGILKDKASILKATFYINRRTSSVHLAVLRATSHSSSGAPSEARISSVLALAHSSRITACACIEALMDRLHLTRSAFVALKCLLTIHSIISKGSYILKDQIAYYPSFGGHNFLNMSMFYDNSSLVMIEFSAWVRWYASVVEQNLMVSRAIGYYLNSTKEDKEDKAPALLVSDLVNEVEVLVEFVVRICDAPNSLELQRNNLVFEVVRAASEDYRSVQREIIVRIKEVNDRVDSVDGLSLSDLTQLIESLERLEGCKGKLMLLFVNRKRNDRMWELVRETKVRLVETKETREEKRLVVVVPPVEERDEPAESTQFWNPFLEPGQLLMLPSAGKWFDFGPIPIAV